MPSSFDSAAIEMLFGGNIFFNTDSLRSTEYPIIDFCLALSHIIRISQGEAATILTERESKIRMIWE